MTRLIHRLPMILSLLVAGMLVACNGSNDNPLLQGVFNPPNRPSGTVMGRVTSSVDGTPISNAVLIVRSHVGTFGGFPDDSEFTFGIQTDNDGFYEAPNTPVGLLTTYAFAQGFQTSAPRQYSLATGAEATMDFVLSPGQGTKPDGSAYDPNKDRDSRVAFPWNYDGNFLSYRPDDD